MTTIAALFVSLQNAGSLWDRIRQADDATIATWIVLLIAAGTVAVAAWEILGEKLSSSARDRNFVRNMRDLLGSLDHFYVTEIPPSEFFSQFAQTLLDAVGETLCGKTVVTAAYMPPEGAQLKIIFTSCPPEGPVWVQLNKVRSIWLKHKTLPPGRAWRMISAVRQRWLILRGWTPYDPELVIPVDPTSPKNSPAALAHLQGYPWRSVYVPLIHRNEKADWDQDPGERSGSDNALKKEVWDIETQGGGVILKSPHLVRWVDAKEERFQNFHSTLCVPVRTEEHGNLLPAGILAISSKRRDPFLQQDFVMADCFARLLGRAISIKQALEKAKVTP